MRQLGLVVSVSVISLAGGCGLYFGDDDCDLYGGDRAAPIEDAIGQRNPATGQCEYFGGGPLPCDSECGPCPAEAGGAEADQAQISWGYCESECTGLEENSCLEVSGCRAIYIDPCGGALDCEAEPIFSECWSTDLTGPIQGGDCAGLDAYECSRHDDCVAIHRDSCAGAASGDSFEAPEPACVIADFLRCGAETPGSDPGLCYAPVDCTALPPECPADTMPGIAEGCFTGYCIPVEDCESQPACTSIEVEASCVARSDCTPLYRGEDCSCDELGCTCASWTFTSCE
jgi:hypothetical protein